MRIARYSYILLLILIIVFISGISGSCQAQDRKYQRKSFSSIGTLLVKGNVDAEVQNIILNRLKSHIEVPRFDYNTISDESVRSFINEANKTDLSPGAIARALDNTVLPGLQTIVSTVAAERATLSDEVLVSRVVDKLKGTGVTAEDVLKVMNSAYIYLPVITGYSEEEKDRSLNVTIEGYVLWYKMKVLQTGEARMILITDTTSIVKGIGSGTMSENYSLKNRAVSGDVFARIDAADTWAKNLATQMKDIPDFRLSAEIMNVEGNRAEARLGEKEGIDLDDGFDAVEQFEDEDGKVTVTQTGFFRVMSVAQNRKDPSAVSVLSNFIGRNERGTIIMERPRLGIDIVIKPKFFALNMPMSDWAGILSEEATSGMGADISLSANLAKLTNVSQLFAKIEFGIGMANAEYSSIFKATVPMIIDVYGGVSKKFWFSRMNLELGAAAGITMLSFNMSSALSPEYTLSMNTYGAKADASLNYLVSPDVSIGINLGYKFTSDIDEVKISDEDGNEVRTFTLSNSKTNFSGISFGANFQYALPSLPFNPFSFLSTGNIDY